LTRTRKQLVHDVCRHSSRIHKTLEDANFKLTSVVSDVLGKTAMAILGALIRGETDPERLADLAQGSLKKKRAELIEACHGKVTPHHRKLLKLHLDVIAALRSAIEEVDTELGNSLDPIKAAVELVDTMPGFNAVSANNVVAEIGIDMTRFPSASHLLSWATLCPRNDESAGRRRSTRTRKGSPWLKTALVTAAWSAVKQKDTYYRAQFLRLKSRRGPKKAIVAVAASMLTAIYHMLRTGAVYKDLGPNHFDQHDRIKTAKRLVRRLHDLGFKVELAA
jgi:transposase